MEALIGNGNFPIPRHKRRYRFQFAEISPLLPCRLAFRTQKR